LTNSLGTVWVWSGAGSSINEESDVIPIFEIDGVTGVSGSGVSDVPEDSILTEVWRIPRIP
jgi:excinuclease UvrABC ATPase subunit